eukprot:m.31345 g.31345  ORF g.31345 m.31345 type:complete len:348 (+) comp4874_c0_seq1:972-2015(+)
MFAPRFDPKKFKTYLRLVNERLKMFQQKQENLNQMTRREIATLIESKREELARIKTEQLIRDDYLIDALAIVELFTNLLLARVGMIEASGRCHESLLEPVCSVVWASPRIEAQVPELLEIRKGIRAHFGEQFEKDALRGNHVHSKLRDKLNVNVADLPCKVEDYMEVIADKYKLPFTRRAIEEPLCDLSCPAFNSEVPGCLLPQPPAPYIGEPFHNPLYTSPAAPPGYPPHVSSFDPALQQPPSAYFPPVPPASYGPLGATGSPPPEKPPMGFEPPPKGYTQPVSPHGRAQSSSSDVDLDLPAVPGHAPGQAASYHPPPAPYHPPADDPPVPELDDLARRFEALRRQ